MFFVGVISSCVSQSKESNQSTVLANTVSEKITIMKASFSDWARNHPREPFQDRHISSEMNEFESSLDKLDPSIKYRLALYTYDGFIVSEKCAYICFGCTSDKMSERENTEKYANGLYWIIPTRAGSGEVLLLFSTVAPKRTTLIGIDGALKMRLLYDSAKEQNIAEIKADGGIDYVCGVRRLNRITVELYEGWITSISQVSLRPRTFILTFKNDEVVVIEK